MIPWIELDRAAVPEGGDIRLKQRGTEFSIMLGATELMNSRASGSEEALARLACEALGTPPRAHVLVGGLGMGFTLRAALARLGPDAVVTVAELVPAVVAWARGALASLHGDSLQDPRVVVREDDVAALMQGRRAAYDIILLDVDNGPDGLTRPGNDGLYGANGLGAARAALRPGGILGVWSIRPDRHFAERLRRAGFAVEEHRVRAGGAGRGARHIVWIARRSSASAGVATRRGRENA